MKLRILFITICMMIVSFGFGQKKYSKSATKLKPIEMHDDHAGCTLFVTDLIRRSNHPFDIEKAKGRSKSGNAQSAVFDIDYIGFTPEAQSSLQFSFDVLSALLTTPVPIRVSATYEVLEQGTLGAARASGFYGTYGNVYPAALAEKIAGFNFDESESGHDIILSINSEANWHLEPTDTIGGIGDKYDLATVMMHEIIHGLGFIGGAGQFADQTLGLRFNSGNVSIYDSFLENNNGVPLIDLGADMSQELTNAMTIGNLFFNSPRLADSLEVYTPVNWQGGSSIYHLNENTTPEADLMMTPFAARGEVRHDPGAAVNMLLDMGWDFTTIIHQPEAIFNENFNEDYLVSAEFITNSGFDSSSVVLVYSQDSFVNQATSVPMTYNMSTDRFEAPIPAPNSEAVFQYRIDATQVGTITEITSPTIFPDFYNYAYLKDNLAPNIDHTEITSINSTDIVVPIKSFVIDSFVTAGIVNRPLGEIESVIVEYSINDGAISSIPSILDEDGFGEFYLANLPITEVITVADVIKYRIIAKDKTEAKNMTTYPADGSFIIVPVNEIKDPTDLYTNDFNDLTNTDFSFDQFEIAEVSGFEDGALTNSVHPYPTAGNDRTENYTASLNTPIIIAADEVSAFIKFKEIVLVEPAEPNSVFGDTDFWDYVIVEAQKLSGGPWEPLLDGYDALAQSTWRFRYLSDVTNNISNSTPIPSMYRDREFSMLSAGSPFEANDTVLIRFRLFSDPGAAGWGWMIDNLNIQDANTNVAVEDFIEEENQFLVYPNPSNSGMITVAASFTQSANNLRTELTDIHGRLIRSERITNGAQFYEQEIDISDLPAGIYFMTLRDSESAITKKVVKY